jgi:hypothetical protein
MMTGIGKEPSFLTPHPHDLCGVPSRMEPQLPRVVVTQSLIYSSLSFLLSQSHISHSLSMLPTISFHNKLFPLKLMSWGLLLGDPKVKQLLTNSLSRGWRMAKEFRISRLI